MYVFSVAYETCVVIQEFRSLKCLVDCLLTRLLTSHRTKNRRRSSTQAIQRPARRAHCTDTPVSSLQHQSKSKCEHFANDHGGIICKSEQCIDLCTVSLQKTTLLRDVLFVSRYGETKSRLFYAQSSRYALR